MTPDDRASELPVPAAAPPPAGPGPHRDVWLPIGPAVTLRGEGDGGPRVAGPVRDIAVSPDGQRCYAASAHGGLWYSDTAGARWEPVGPFAMATSHDDLVSSHTLACGAVHVRFDPGDDPAKDEVWVGTGEPGPFTFFGVMTPFDLGTHGQYGGVGVLHAVGPVAASRTNPLADPWTLQAQPRPAAYQGLRNEGTFRFAADPADDRRLVAATSRGLHHHGTGPTTDPWDLVTVAAWEALDAGASARIPITDVVWTPATATHPARLWVAVLEDTPIGLAGVWVSENGVAGPFDLVALPGVVVNGALAVSGLGLAADPAFPDVVYVLGSGPQLWRIDQLTPATAQPLPADLFAGTFPTDQADYSLALAVDPGNVNRVLVGGAFETSPHDGSQVAALYRLTLSGVSPAYTTDFVAGGSFDPTWVGAGVRSFVHRIRWQRVGPDSQVWVCSDGGVFRSIAAADRGSFVSRSTELAIMEAGFVANHPLTDGVVLAGGQSNGPQLRIGEAVWRRLRVPGFGGGVAFAPGAPGRFVAQVNRGRWLNDGEEAIGPIRRSKAPSPAFDTENGNSSPYSNPAVVRRADGVTQLVVGTTRVWYSESWGRSHWDGTFWQRDWRTLPGLTDPRANDANDATTDTLATGLPPQALVFNSAMPVRALRWAGPDRLYVAAANAVFRFDRDPPTTGPWTRTTILILPPMSATFPPPWPVALTSVPDGMLNDLAVHDPGAGPHGSFYLALMERFEPVWWFDGTSQLHPVRLGSPVPPTPLPTTDPPLPPNGVRGPGYAVVVDPDDSRIVFAGTTRGVWRGELTLGATPSWVWTPFNVGLPEAAAQDLSIATWPRPAGPPLKLLRAALQSRGVWEVEPGVDAAPATYLRVHPYDTRRITPTDLRDPVALRARPAREWPLDWADRRNRVYLDVSGRISQPAPDGTPAQSYFWHGSPDIRLRPARVTPATLPVPAPPDLPWSSRPPDVFWLWSLQTALRTLDPLVVPDARLIVPDGQWTRVWENRLAAINVALGVDPAPGQFRVSESLWRRPAVQAGFWADPWADSVPTEADLIERVVGGATPRVGGPRSAATSPASLAVLRRPYRVDVCVHHRGSQPLAVGTVAVLLLRVPLPANPLTWATLAPLVLPTGSALTALHAALDALPAAGGPLPSQLTLPAGWAAADVGRPVRRPDRPVATAAPAVLTFDVDFSTAAAGSRFLFVALVHSTAADPLTFSGANLRAMVLGSRHAAARSVQIV